MISMTSITQIAYFLAMISFIVGLKYLSSPKKARLGNILAGVGMILAIVVTVANEALKSYQEVGEDGAASNFKMVNFTLILIAIFLGTVVGKRISDKAEMTKMPQLVSFFNAMGGGCAMLLGLLESQVAHEDSRLGSIVLLVAMMIGAASFSGSIIAYLKLAGKQKDKRSMLVMVISRLTLLLMVLIPVFVSYQLLPIDSLFHEALILVAIALIYGVFFVFPIGGADMPVVISLLNSFTGVATALAGIMFHNIIMIAGGIFVGAAGVLLTLLMCTAMNRSLWNVLAGKFKGNSAASADGEEMEIKPISVGEVTTSLAFANKIAIIPGYGLAVAQAQHLCGQLENLLESKGVEVDYIIHPVAGRMPGHMNVLLAEADVSYEKLKEMDEVNDQMSSYDMAIVIGANDVVNPAAEKDPNSPIYGMPIIKAYNAKQVVVIKRGMAKGYAGIENSLFGEENCHLLFLDAKIALNGIISELKNLD